MAKPQAGTDEYLVVRVEANADVSGVLDTARRYIHIANMNALCSSDKRRGHQYR